MRLITFNKIKLLVLAIATYSSVSSAAPFDKTGLIDLKNEATTRASCEILGGNLIMATNTLSIRLRQLPAKTQDEQWKNMQNADRLDKFGEVGEYVDRVLSDKAGENVPPSQLTEYLMLRTQGIGKVQQLCQSNPQLVISAFESCLVMYKFRK
jgi:hypothetical protein